MPAEPAIFALRGVCATCLSPPYSDATDGHLLERFLAHRDEAAFTALVHRHGRMVLGVCRNTLRNRHDAEDAFQATFLVLARKAATITPRTVIGAWLHGVARRTALKAKLMAARRRFKEQQVPAPARAPAPSAGAGDEVTALLDEELAALPMKYRSAIVLCDLEGQTKRAAARHLGCPEGTLSSRLARGRRMLARRLTRRGVTLSVGALTAALAQIAGAGVRSSLVVLTGRTAARSATEHVAAADMISARVATLTEGVLKSMLLNKLKTATAVLLLVGVLVGGVALKCHTRASEPSQPAGAPVPPPDPADAALQAIIAQVLKAHGGEERLKKLETFTFRTTTSCVTVGDTKDCRFFVRLPEQVRAEVSHEGRESARVLLVTNGEQRWRKLNDGETTAGSAGTMEVVKFVGPRALLRLKDPEMKVSLVGERPVGDTGSLLGDRAAICVRLVRKDGKKFAPLHELNCGSVDEVRLYFDTGSHLLLKEEFEDRNWKTEVFHSNYKTISGIAVAQKLTGRTNGEVNYRSEVEFRVKEKLADTLFEKPR
ncbi:RNA polymerase sigma factor [Frigoriglobus tundricola]|uniref:ECF RNA polymerase sigma factor SigE n=1 Tax=Frigoriglobus tundricola TaxID=2774151 RepID=A0A6M5Z345_9BACT|nr:RNA polymerase sigma factor [Frigoriglobus tundricola]QJW99861.1 hypothetical protein FTUN_7484 [Frigoriglobus tundricola]